MYKDLGKLIDLCPCLVHWKSRLIFLSKNSHKAKFILNNRNL